MKPRLLIVDDEAPARRRLKTLLQDVAASCPHELVGEAENAQQALQSISELRPDVVLLDVQMPDMNGIELARCLARQDHVPAVIFVTAFDEYAVKAFEVHAFDYLLKPVRAQRLADAVMRVASLRGNAAVGLDALAAEQPARRHFSVQERGRVLLVPVSEVLYCKAELKYVTLRTREHEYLLEESLVSIEEELKTQFVRIHRNALVARDAIAGVERAALRAEIEEGERETGEAADRGERAQESWQVIVRGLDERLPISRRQWSIVKALVRC
ncbi:MAG TPA: LytTR family DNA-binding domain-containing protein [Noviherbaspirillum sp.]